MRLETNERHPGLTAAVMLGSLANSPELVARRQERRQNPELLEFGNAASRVAGFDVHNYDPQRAGRGLKVGCEVWSPEMIKRRLARVQNPVVPNMADRQAWMLYDRLKVAASTAISSPYTFFQNGTGTGTPPKPKEDTNLIQSGRLEDPQRFFVTALRFVFSSDMYLADMFLFQKNYYAEFWIGSKIYQEGPLPLFPGGAGTWGATTRSDQSVFGNGVPDPRSINLLGEEGIWILQGQQFRVEIKTSATGTTSSASGAPGINILCVLDGILYRQVQ